MAKRYDLLDTETGNLLGRFTREDDVMAFVRALIDANGDDVVETIVLGGRDELGRVLPAETGAALARRAIASVDPLPLVGRS